LLAGFVSGFFLYAASFKTLDSTPLRTTLEQLGIPERLAPSAAILIPIFEVVVGLCVLGVAPNFVAVTLIIVAALAIGAAGFVALRLDKRIPCSCFSKYASTMLGRRQIITAFALVLAATGLSITNPQRDGLQAMAWLGVVSCSGAAAHLVTALGDLRSTVRYRRWASSQYPA
jgi:hypothetical protein